jgi:hypothetical protein
MVRSTVVREHHGDPGRPGATVRGGTAMRGPKRRRPVVGLVIGAVAIAVAVIAFANKTPTNNKDFEYAVALWG